MATVATTKFKIGNDVVALIFGTHMWGVEKTADKTRIQTDADKSMLKLTKSLIDCNEYDAVCKYMSRTREWITNYSVPSFFQRGSYLFRVRSVDMVEAGLRMRNHELQGLVDKLIEVYPEKKEEARVNLKTQYKEADYPTEEAIRAAIYFSHQWIEFVVPDTLPKKVREEAIRNFQNMWDNTARDVCSVLRTGFAGMVDRAVDRLTPTEDGGKKRLHETILTNLVQFCNTFQARNVIDDQELEGLVSRVQGILSEVEGVGVLRDNEQFREQVLARFVDVQNAIRPLTDGMRKIDV